MQSRGAEHARDECQQNLAEAPQPSRAPLLLRSDAPPCDHIPAHRDNHWLAPVGKMQRGMPDRARWQILGDRLPLYRLARLVLLHLRSASESWPCCIARMRLRQPSDAAQWYPSPRAKAWPEVDLQWLWRSRSVWRRHR